MMSAKASTKAALPKMSKVVFLTMPTYFNPGWERLVTGRRIDEVDFYSLSFLQQVLVSKSFVHHSRSNPRSIEYMLEFALEFLSRTGQSPEILLLTDKVAQSKISTELRAKFKSILLGGDQGLSLSNLDQSEALKREGYDALLFLYPDAIGLGWTSIERDALRWNSAYHLALNGRRRIFVLDKTTRRRLIFRRTLERVWVVELVLAIGLVLVSIPLAFYDLTLGKILRNQRGF